MDEQRRRILEDLSGELDGELRCDDLAVSMYASDASLFQVRPLGVACPRSAEDVVILARYASEASIPLIARGAGSSVTGASLGEGLIVDFSRFMREIESIDDNSVTVQPGVVLDRLNEKLRERGRYFPPDPSTAAVTTVGGMLGVDSAGSRAVRIGSTRDHVVTIDLVTAGGHLMNCGIESLDFQRQVANPFVSDDDGFASASVHRTIVSKLGKLLADNAELIEKHQPSMFRNTSGYFLRGVRRSNEINLPRLLVGSEGTLGMFTSVTLHTSVLPEFRGVALLLFGTMEQAIDAVLAVMPQQPSACDLLDRRLLMLGREHDSRFNQFIPAGAEAGLLIEQTGFSEVQVRDRIAMAIAAVQDRTPDMQTALEAYDYDGVEFLWELPRRVVGMLARMKGATRALPFTEDVAIPPKALREFFIRIQRVLQKHEVTSSMYSHAASGQIHMRPFMTTPKPADASKLSALASDFNSIVLSLGGTISGEHGDGISRSCFVEQQYGPLYAVFRQVKDIFDPHNLMNPGKIITEIRSIPASKMRPVPETFSDDLVQLQLQWNPAELAERAEACDGCGVCRTQQDELRMCPFFRLDPSEEASPRSKANVMRSLVAGNVRPVAMQSPEFQHLASLCFNCRQCELECPSSAHIPHMMIEAKAQALETSGIDRTTWLLSRAHSFGDLGCSMSFLMSRVMKSKPARWLIEKLIGIDRRRRIPRFARKPFLKTLPRKNSEPAISVDRKTIVYFVDHFANYHDVELAQAFVAVMKHQGYQVHIPRDQTGSGMAMLSAGDLDSARRVAAENVRELVTFAQEEIPIVCTEPAAALCLSQDYPMLLDDPDALTVAGQVIEAGAFLAKLADDGRLKTDLGPLPLRAGYHTPCHLKALRRGLPLRKLMDLIPELDVVTIEKGCSGMAGAFGLTRENFDVSMEIGRPLMERIAEPDLMIGATECSSCRLQMEQNSDKPTVHPIKLLAASYGLLPGLRESLLWERARAENNSNSTSPR